MIDFERLFEEPEETEELTAAERDKLHEALYTNGIKAHKILEEWLLTFKKLGYWSSCDEELRSIVHAYSAFESGCMECPKFEECTRGEFTVCIVDGGNTRRCTMRWEEVRSSDKQ